MLVFLARNSTVKKFTQDDDDENSFSIRKIKRDTGFGSDDEDNSNLSKPENDDEKKEKEMLSNLFDSDAENTNDGEQKPKEISKESILMPPPPPQPAHYDVS